MKILILLGLLFSLNSFAGYKCTLELADSGDEDTIIANETIEASDKDLGTRNIDNLFTEFEMGDDSTRLTARVFISGWLGEEETNITIVRREEKEGDVKFNTLSEKISLRGDASESSWFEHYKLSVSCSLI